MTQDEIIAMAREAGGFLGELPKGDAWMFFEDEYLERFAALVAAREREKQAEQEPVGYWQGKFSQDGGAVLYEVPQASAFGYHYPNYPVYAAPQPDYKALWEQMCKRCDELDLELAKYTEQEPVAWGWATADGEIVDCICPAQHDITEGYYTIPLYTQPVRTKDLTDAEIADALYGKGCWRLGVHPDHLREYRRVIQADRELNK